MQWPRENADVLLIGAPKPTIVNGLEPGLHLAQAGRRQGPRQVPRRRRAARARHGGGGDLAAGRRRVHVALPQARDRLQLRRRLRPCRRQMGRPARHHRHQHAGCAQRGGGRHRHRPAAQHGARISPGGALPARRQVGGTRLSAHQGDAARPHRRHDRHGTHRQGDRAPARRVRRPRRLSQPQSATRRELPSLSQPRRDGARGRCPHGHRAGRGGDPEPDQRARCWKRSAPTVS